MDSSNLNQIEQSDKYGGFPMKWHKFLIYFLLWFLLVLLLLNGIWALVQYNYGYFFLPSLIIWVPYAISLFVLAGYTIFTRIYLARMKRNAPIHIFILPLVLVFSRFFSNMISLLIDYFWVLPYYYHVRIHSFAFLMSLWFSDPFDIFLDVIDFFVIIPLAILTFIYYKKRKSLFVN